MSQFDRFLAIYNRLRDKKVLLYLSARPFVVE